MRRHSTRKLALKAEDVAHLPISHIMWGKQAQRIYIYGPTSKLQVELWPLLRMRSRNG